MESIEEESEAPGPDYIVPEVAVRTEELTDKGARRGVLRRLGLGTASELWWYCVTAGVVVGVPLVRRST